MKHKDREKILLERVYKALAPVYFNCRMKMVPSLNEKIEIPKSLARDIANYVQGKNPEYFHLIERKCNTNKK